MQINHRGLPPDLRRRLRVLEPLLFASLAMSYIWLIQPIRNDWLRVPFLIVVVLIPLLSNYLHQDRLADMGLRLDNLPASAREVGVFTLIASCSVVGLAFSAGESPELPFSSLVDFLIYPFWGLLQHYAMQSFVHRRFRESLGSPNAAIIASAVLFAIMHWPNKLLTIFTLLGGLAWCKLFSRHPNLLTLAISHGILAVLLYHLCPEDWVNNLRIGPRFYK